MEKRLLTVKEAAVVLGICERSVRAELRSGELRYVAAGPNRTAKRIDVRELDRYIEARSVEPPLYRPGLVAGKVEVARTKGIQRQLTTIARG